MNDKKLVMNCPHCGREISIEDALSHQIKKTISEDAKKQAKEELTKEIQYLQEQNKKKESELGEARKIELELRKEKNKLNEEKESFELEKQRQIDGERNKIREETAKKMIEEQRFKDAEKDKMISDLKKSVEEMRLKASQGSQQTQGEVQELDLEQELKEAFPTDEIEEIKKGERGADAKQTVRTAKGNICGVILWESKRTKVWKEEFINKLKEDLRSANANIPVIVTNVMPKESKKEIDSKNGVWICTYGFAIILAGLLRQRLIEVAREKFLSKNQGTKAEELYSYIMGHEFRNHIEAIVETYVSMKEELVREQRAFQTIWKNREEQMDKMIKSTARIAGSISGKAGAEFQPVKGLELLESGK